MTSPRFAFAAGTIFSPCRTWRYTLARSWGIQWAAGGPVAGYANFVCLNPSTADEAQDDPTVRRCLDFARRWGYGGCMVTNIFAYRSTDPKALREVPDLVGPGNAQAVLEVARNAALVVAAWGVHGAFRERGVVVADMLDRAGVKLFCLGLTKDDYPKHPLYLPKSARLLPYLIDKETYGSP